MKIGWVYEGEQGFWRSMECRFSISPIYLGRTTPQGYEARDAITGKTHRGFHSVNDAKDYCRRLCEHELTLELGIIFKNNA
jgi:hypothetical protein